MFVDIVEAQRSLSRLVTAIYAGTETEIIITRDGKPVAKLVPAVRVDVTNKRLGHFEGVYPPMSLEDFDADNEEIAAMFYGDGSWELKET